MTTGTFVILKFVRNLARELDVISLSAVGNFFVHGKASIEFRSTIIQYAIIEMC
jgi:hypothetical protein